VPRPRPARTTATAALLAFVLAGCAATADIAADEPAAKPRACEHPGPHDINGDGHADVVVSERSGGVEQGAIRVLYGTSAGLTSSGAEGGLDDQYFTQSSPGVPGTPSAWGDDWGRALAVADFDDDGCADVAVGAPDTPLDGPTDTKNRGVGAVTVLYGSPAGLRTALAQTVEQDDGGSLLTGLLEGRTVAVPGEREPEDRFGSALAAGDFDGDGHADLVIAADGDAPGPNRVRLPGPPVPEGACRGMSKCLPPGPRTVPAPELGTVSVVYGSPDGLGDDTRPAISLTHSGIGGSADDRYAFGKAFAVGDFDADGVDDLAVTASPHDEDPPSLGAVQILRGSKDDGLVTKAATSFDRDTGGFPGQGSDDGFGYLLAAGDLDGNGADDLAIGVPAFGRRGPNSGAVVVLYSRGRAGLSTQGAQQWTPTSPGLPRPTGGGDFGQGLAIGQFGGPGTAEDLAVGAPATYADGNPLNSASVLFGTAAGLTAAGSVQLVPTTRRSTEGFGTAMAALPVRGGAYDDLLVGAPWAGDNATPPDGIGALDVYPAGPAGPVAADVRRFRPDDHGMAGIPVRGASMGQTIG
jgi:hypothetical protein